MIVNLKRCLTRLQLRGASSLGAALAILYVGFAIFVFNAQYEGSWGGFLLFWAAFPASMLTFVLPDGRGGNAILVVVGGLWWYAVGHYFQYGGRI